MWDFLHKLLTSDFMPHGNCYRWSPEIVWLHVISDSLVALAYYSIPITLLYFVRKRRDIPYRWMFIMFGAFIVACGTTHLMEVWTVWHGTYRLAGVVKAVTAVLSIGTAILLVKLIPEALTLRSPTELAGLNQNLEREVRQRSRAEDALRIANDGLEHRVQERTQELATINQALQNEIADRKRAEELAVTRLREKDLLLQEVNHRVKNNLQLVSSLLRLQLANVRNPEVMGLLTESQHRIQSMALVHEQLYKSKDFSHIDFGDYLRLLTSNLLSSFGTNPDKIQLKMELADVLLSLDVAIPCALIVNELVSNSLKYAFPEGRKGEIRIALSCDPGGKIVLAASDNGIGLPPSVNPRRTETLGLQLVNTLTMQLRGTLDVRSETGVHYTITFPPPKPKPPA
jgi:two-component sensor histidine kinase